MNDITSTYNALTIVSAMMFGDDEKDQDRARWYGPGQIACVCDGVTSSPCSGRGAELVTLFAPIIFDGNNKDKLKTICDLLIALREEYMHSDLIIPEGKPPAMQDTLKKVTQEKRATSFQTTVVSLKIVCKEKTVTADIIKCGDSAFFAFSHKGELLSSSLTHNICMNGSKQNKRNNISSSFNSMSFNPGSQILVRVEGLLSSFESLAKKAQVKNKHLNNWMLCTPIEVCNKGMNLPDMSSSPMLTFSLKPSDYLLLPKYLYGRKLKSDGQRYYILDYSSTIRILSEEGIRISNSKIAQRGSTTVVLPDHLQGGYVEFYKDSFPLGTNFVLCSDGFYNCFYDAKYIWQWLRDNSRALSHSDEKQSLLRRLHNQLNDKGGDDDISFVWAYPRKKDD